MRLSNPARSFLLLVMLLLISSNVVAAAAIGKHDENNWSRLYEQGVQFFELGKFADAERCLLQSLNLSVGAPEKQCAAIEALSSLYLEQEDYAQAEKLLLDYLRYLRSDNEFSPSRQAFVLSKLGSVNAAANNLKNAEAYHRRALPIFVRTFGYHSPETAMELNNLACVEFRQSKMVEAVQHFLASANILSKTLGKNSLPYGLVAVNLAELYENKKNTQNALLWYQQSTAAFDATLGPRNPVSIELHERCKILRSKKPPIQKKPPVRKNPAGSGVAIYTQSHHVG